MLTSFYDFRFRFANLIELVNHVNNEHDYDMEIQTETFDNYENFEHWKKDLETSTARGLLNTEEIVRAKIIPLHGTIAIERGNMKQKAKESAR